MTKRALTAAALERLKPPIKGQVDHFDAGYPGLAIRLSYGGRRSWTFHYRIHGKTRRMTLGAFPAMGLAEARWAWREVRAAVERGEDPGAAKLEARHCEPETVRQVGDEFIRRYARPRNRTANEIERMFEIYVYPLIGERPVETVTRRDVLRLLDKAEERGIRVRANRVLASVRRLFNWSVERGIIEASPVNNIRPPAVETPRDRVLSDDEMLALLRACDRMGEPFGQVFRLLLLTAQRRDEVAAARWVEFDLRSALWHLPAERVKNARAHTLPLSTQVMTTVESLSTHGSDFLFPATFSRLKDGAVRPVSGFTRAKKRLDMLMLDELEKIAAERGKDRTAIHLPAWRLHDLRRTAASGMARLGTEVHVVEKALNHISGTVSGIAAVYNRHSYRDEVQTALQAWADFVDGLSAVQAGSVGIVHTS